jgi:predicted TIM-barrel fold metal-dependent hydrolase
MRAERVVDVHSHYLPDALVRALERRDAFPLISDGPDGRMIRYGKGNGHPMLPAMTDLDVRLGDMDEQGIDMAVLSVIVPGVDWFPAADGVAVARDANDELAEVTRAHPDRFAAMAVLPTQAPEAAAAELERATALGLRGAIVYSNAAGRNLDEPDLQVIFDTAAALGQPIYLHPTFPLSAPTMSAYALIPTLGFLVDTTTAALRLVLGGLYDRHPDFKLVVSHVASLIPYLVGRIDYEAGKDPNGYGALSVPPSEHLRLLYTDGVCAWPPALRLAVEFLGADRVMFGSDYPYWDPADSSEALRAAGFTEADAQAIRCGTADSLFSIKEMA